MSDDAVELVLYIENDGDLYRQQYQPILKNLANKRANGIYSIPAAQKLYGYLVESGAKKYAKEFGSPGQPWHKMFSVAVRKEAAADLEKKFRAEDDLGAYKHLLTKAALKRLEHGHSDCAKSGVLAKACRTASGHASGSSAVRYSGELVLRVSWKERPGPNGTYTVHISHGGKKLGTQHVGAPAFLSHGVDSSEAYDEAAHAAISFAGDDVGEYAATNEDLTGWHIGRSVTAKWPKAGRSAGKSGRSAGSSEIHGIYLYDNFRWRMLERVAKKPGMRAAHVLHSMGGLPAEKALGDLRDRGYVTMRDDTHERPLEGRNVYLTEKGREALAAKSAFWLKVAGKGRSSGTTKHNAASHAKGEQMAHRPQRRSAGKSANNAAKMPPLSKWDTFAGGTSAPSNSTSYSITFNGRKYMISPLGARNNVERLAGYALDVFPGEYHGWTRIGHFSRAASAAKAASIYAGKH